MVVVVVVVVAVVVAVVAFSSLARILGRMFNYSFSACTFFFFLEVEISSRTLIPFIMPDQSTVA